MGAGKSTIGRRLAKRLNKDFYDSDHVIEERTGVDIATIFEIEGEQGFREREEQVIAELCQMTDIILATGGGCILRDTNRKNIQQGGHVVYLQTSANLLYSRIRHDKSRPLMQTNNPKNTLKKLLNDREPYYLEVADTVVMTGKQKVSILVREVGNILKEKLAL